jgi:hypothetical protein
MKKVVSFLLIVVICILTPFSAVAASDQEQARIAIIELQEKFPEANIDMDKQLTILKNISEGNLLKLI